MMTNIKKFGCPQMLLYSDKLGLSVSVHLGKTPSPSSRGIGLKGEGWGKGEVYSLALVVNSLALEEPTCQMTPYYA